MLNKAGSIIENLDTDNLIETVEAVAEYIRTKRIEDEKGIRWIITDAFEGKHFCNDEISLYSGSAGIGSFLLDLYDSVKKEEYLKDAIGAADYILWRWENERELDKNFSKYAYTTGYAGIAVYLDRIYEVTRDKRYYECFQEIINECMKDAKVPQNGVGRYWGSFPGIVGNAGTILFLLHAGNKYNKEEWKTFAVEAGRYYLDKGHEYKGGVYYEGVDPSYFNAGLELIDPNFPMGTAGIGYLLLKLYEETKDERFLKAEERIPFFEDSIAAVQSKGILLPHALPYRKDLFYLGYCHGPAGTIRYYYQGYKIRKEESYKRRASELLDGLMSTGAPQSRTDGFWNVHNLCCGTAGFILLFSGLLRDRKTGIGDESMLYTMLYNTGKVLMESATIGYSETGKKTVCWEQALDRITPQRLSRSIGFYDGAAGIADALLILYSIAKGKYFANRAIDDPFPAR